MNILETITAPNLDGEDLLDVAKALTEAGLWTLRDDTVIAPKILPSEVSQDPDALDLGGFLYWCLFQEHLHFEINGYQSARDDHNTGFRKGKLIAVYAGNETQAMGIKILDETLSDQARRPRAFQMFDVEGKPHKNVISFRVANEDEGLHHYPPYLPEIIKPGEGLATQPYSKYTALAFLGEHYPLIKSVIPPLLALQKQATELLPPVEWEKEAHETKAVDTTTLVIETIEAKVSLLKVGELITRPTWWGIYKPDRVKAETSRYIMLLRFLGRSIEQAFYQHFLAVNVEPTPVKFLDEMVGRTVWRTATVNGIKLQARVKKKVEKVAHRSQ